MSRRAQRTRGSPLEFWQEHAFVAHAACAPQDCLDRRVDRLDHAEANLMVTVSNALMLWRAHFIRPRAAL